MIAEILTNLILKALAWWYARWKAARQPVDEGIADHEAHWPHAYVWDAKVDPKQPVVVQRDAEPEWVLPTGLTEEELEDWVHAQERRS